MCFEMTSLDANTRTNSYYILFLWLCFNSLPGLKNEADTSDDNLLLIFQPFNSLICSFQFNLRFFFFSFFFFFLQNT